MPQPAKSRIWCGSVSLSWPQRSAMAHSPSPFASIQPTGPAYRLDQVFQLGDQRTRAVGWRTANSGVGCRAAASAGEATPCRPPQ